MTRSARLVLTGCALAGATCGSSAPGISSPPAVLTLHAAKGTYFPDWIDSSNPDYDEDGDSPGVSPIYRIRGDAYSPYYYFRRGAQGDEFRTNDGRILARTSRYSVLLGIRKSSDRLAVFLYYQRSDRMSDYNLVLIERGAARVFHCAISLATYNAAQGTRFATVAAAVAAGGPQTAVVDLLESAEPALSRDRCRLTTNGVRRGEDNARRPFLRIPFPAVGQMVEIDEQGFRGGWLYEGVSDDPTGGRRKCCVFTFSHETREALLFTDKGTRGKPPRILVKRIVYQPRRVPRAE